MKTSSPSGVPAHLTAVLICAFATSPLRAEREIEDAFRDALYAEEVKGDLEGALKAYQDVGARFELQRDMAAAALFREGECLRKLGRNDEATAIYKKILAQYGDKERTARLSRENLAALGQPLPAVGAPEIPAAASDEEVKELARLRAMAQDSPDLLGQGSPLPLADAVKKGRTAVVAWLLERLPKQPPEVLGSQLREAAARGHLRICELLADAGANLSGGAALHAALNGNRLAVAGFLLERKADVNELGPMDNPPNPIPLAGFGSTPQSPYALKSATPLMIAAASTGVPVEFFRKLLEAGARVNGVAQVEEQQGARRPGSEAAPAFSYPLTALGAAVAAADKEKVRLLLAAGADVNQPAGDLEATPLLIALAAAREVNAVAVADPVVAMLLRAGAQWTARLSTGATALHITARRGLSGWLAEALKAGVDVKAVDRRGFTALHDASDSPSSLAPEIVSTLIAAGASVDLASAAAQGATTPLGLACLSGRSPIGLETIKALLEGGADPNRAGSDSRLPLELVVQDSFYSAGRWPGAVKLLIEHGARPADAKIFAERTSNAVPLDEAALDAFRVAWKAAYWRDNPRLSHAVWVSQSESALKMGRQPTFNAILCDESAAGPPTLRDVIGLTDPQADWSKITIIRNKDGKEETTPVEVLVFGKDVEAKDHQLQWGDVVETSPMVSPEAAEQTAQLLSAWLKKGTKADIRIQLGQQRFVANVDGSQGPVVRIEGQSYVDLSTIIRAAGLTDLLSVVEGVRRTQRDGTLGVPEGGGVLRHGDILLLHAAEPKQKLSDEALRSGIWLCQSMEGPFWPVPGQHDVMGKPAPLAGIVVALLGAHPLASPTFDWEKATVRYVVDGKQWKEEKLLEAWPALRLSPGTVLILPAADRDTFEPPTELRAALSKALSVHWLLSIGQQPLVDSSWDPRFFRGNKENGAWVWRDIDPTKWGIPLLPTLQDLLAAHPSAGDFKHSTSDPVIISSTDRTERIDGKVTQRWLDNSRVLHVEEADRSPPSTSVGRSVPWPPAGRRRVILPPSTEEAK